MEVIIYVSFYGSQLGRCLGCSLCYARDSANASVTRLFCAGNKKDAGCGKTPERMTVRGA